MIAATSNGAVIAVALLAVATPVARAVWLLADRLAPWADRHHLAACLDNDTKDTTP